MLSDFRRMLFALGAAGSALGLGQRAAQAADELPLLNQDSASESKPVVTDDPPEPSAEPSVEAAPKPCPVCRHALGGQALWVQGKFVPEFAGRFDPHRWFWIDVELGLTFLLDPPPGEERVLLGSPLAAHFVLVPLRDRRFELGLGLGGDLHLLYGIEKGIAEVALAVKGVGHVWITPRLGVFGSARVYPVATNGLGLGEKRDGSRGLPVLFGTGVEWGFP